MIRRNDFHGNKDRSTDAINHVSYNFNNKTMKKTITSISKVILITILAACTASIPKSVTDNFTGMFPDAHDVEWELDEDNQWEAEFEMNGMEYSACFSETGDWLETEMGVALDELPDTVVQVLALQYEGFEIEEAEWVETPDFKGYELELERVGETEEGMELLITAEGKVMQEEMVQEEEHENDAGEAEDHDHDHDHDED